MQRHVLRITTTLDVPSPARSSPLSRSPLSPITAPNELRSHKKSIRQVAFERRQKIAVPNPPAGSIIPTAFPSYRRRAVTLWGTRPSERSRMAEGPSAWIEKKTPYKWVKGEALGRGAHGLVYLGLNATTGEIIAVKQISFSPDAPSTGRPSPQTIRREMENMEALRHPNLVEYLGLEEDGESVSIFMEYIAGSSIRAKVLEHGAFADDMIKSCTSQILRGLAYLHDNGIIHGELKSSNILVDSTGVCKIEGLGCSETEIRDNSWAVPRAVFWTAPEVIGTQYKAYTAMADIWSLGCVVLEMFTGKRPWSELEAVAVLFKLYHQTLRPQPPADVDLTPYAQDFMEKCLAFAVNLIKHPYLVLPPA
ncbi:kinase-like protein [Mycena galericulata]|nr:kinase-like protein [Mycena galericulata]